MGPKKKKKKAKRNLIVGQMHATCGKIQLVEWWAISYFFSLDEDKGRIGN